MLKRKEKKAAGFKDKCGQNNEHGTLIKPVTVDNDNEMTMTMKNIYLTINQQIAKYSSKLLLL